MQQIKIVSPEDLLEKEEISIGEYRCEFTGRKVIIFESYDTAVEFGKSLFNSYLMPTYGLENARRFPIARTGPRSSDSKTLASVIMGEPESINKECWLLVPEDKYPEVEKFLNETYLKEHQDVVRA